MQKPKKWTEVYPQGTKEGDEEQKFFIALARHPKYDWRSTAAIVKETSLPQERVEEIIQKYIIMGLVFGHPTNEDHWGYWERVPKMLIKPKSISNKDQDKRIKEHLQNADYYIGDGASMDDDDWIFDVPDDVDFK